MLSVIDPDSFKECATAPRVATAIAAGWHRAMPAELIEIPLADGSEGTVEAVVAATGGTTIQVEVLGPLGEPVLPTYGLIEDGRTAVMEMAEASGLMRVASERRDPRRASTFGTGHMLADALARGARRIVLGIGGSATNDGGAGLALALDYHLLDEEGHDLPPGGSALARLLLFR